MGGFFDKLRAVADELDDQDKAFVLAIGGTLFDNKALLELWPDAEPLVEGAVVGDLLKMAYDRESAAKARGARGAERFFAYVVDAFLRLIETEAGQ